MPALGLVLSWGGYWLLAYGLALRKGAQVGLVDMALPSRRDATLSAIRGAYVSSASAGPHQPSQSKKKDSIVPLVPLLPGFGPKVHIPGTKLKVQL